MIFFLINWSKSVFSPLWMSFWSVKSTMLMQSGGLVALPCFLVHFTFLGKSLNGHHTIHTAYTLKQFRYESHDCIQLIAIKASWEIEYYGIPRFASIGISKVRNVKCCCVYFTSYFRKYSQKEAKVLDAVTPKNVQSSQIYQHFNRQAPRMKYKRWNK